MSELTYTYYINFVEAILGNQKLRLTHIQNPVKHQRPSILERSLMAKSH